MKINKTKFAALVLSFVLVLINTGCVPNGGGDSSRNCYVYYEIKSDKTDYAYGETITLELLFNISNPSDHLFRTKDGNLYTVKLPESPEYEIIGKNVFYTDGSENTELIEGKWGKYCYKATFEIRVNEPADGMQFVELLVGCATDEWLKNCMETESFMSPERTNDPEHPFSTGKYYFGFEADSEGIHFTGPNRNIG